LPTAEDLRNPENRSRLALRLLDLLN
jgi:hypothetical protein